MILFKLPFVIPTRTSWLVMLVLIGIFGFCAQVCHLILSPLSLRPISDRLIQPIKILLTMGLQRETAGRGALAIYTSVCSPRPPYPNAKSPLRQIVFAVVFEFAAFHTTPSTLSIIGALMIVSSAIYTTVIFPLSLLNDLMLTFV